MDVKQQSLQELQQIKRMMERSSKFISLSGLSGIAAGICALVGAWFASQKINYSSSNSDYDFNKLANHNQVTVQRDLFLIALLTFAAAFISAILLTYLRSKKTETTLWGTTTFRLFWNTVIPLLAGGLFLIRSMQLEQYELIAPGCLIFYGLALINASKYTLGEVRYLGYGQIILGIINLWMIGYGLYFWAAGFGLLHIIYGIVMWNKYERENGSQTIMNNE
ncbi:MAG: hypothetical protein WKF85_07090 [Chitinophagaceae bacterium]